MLWTNYANAQATDSGDNPFDAEEGTDHGPKRNF